MGFRATAFVLLLILPAVLASDWDDFTDNLATDLAPLISLFGERLTKQFLSESTSVLDNFTFAVAPLGILTAVVSAIRVCGNSSVRAFVGRAQEGPGDAENELLSCVSETTAELFNDGGISRVFGKPKILEVVAWKSPGCNLLELGTLQDALRLQAWGPSTILDGSKYVPELDIPNLSLNKGIKRRSPIWFYCAAVLGFVSQSGVLIYSAITVFLYPDDFKKNGNVVPGYAFPLFLLGTIFLGVGMFLCAFVIERSSREYYLQPKNPSKIYWLQPGGQNVGDQVFGAFLGVTEGCDSQASRDFIYTKSIRDSKWHVSDFQLLLIVSVTMVGFVLQFVGLRGLHASVILAQMGCTLLMAIVRTCLRTKRIEKDENKFSVSERKLTAQHNQELDCFAFHLEDVKSFNLLSAVGHESAQYHSDCSSEKTYSPYPTIGMRALRARTCLADLTSGQAPYQNIEWDDIPIRKVAQNLARTIETTMDMLSSWRKMPDESGDFKLVVKCDPLDQKLVEAVLDTYTIKVERLEDTLRWKVNERQLEAVIGLWTWSLVKSNEKWNRNSFRRLVGLGKAEAGAEETDLYFHKWIYRGMAARMVSSQMVSSSHQMFGFDSNDLDPIMEILTVISRNKLETMAAQDIFVYFLKSIFETFDKLGGDTSIRPAWQDTYYAHHTHIEQLVDCFVTGQMGSRQDGLLCIIPSLRHRGLLPELAADSTCVRKQVEEYIADDRWSEAFSIVRWLCERCEGEEFERSIFELGFLCQKAMLHSDPNIQQKGFDEIREILRFDIRASYFAKLPTPRKVEWMSSPKHSIWWKSFTKQLGWVIWHICHGRPNMLSMKLTFESLGATRDLIINPGADERQGNSDSIENNLLQWLTYTTDDLGFMIGNSDEDDLLCLLQCVTQSAQTALQHWLLVKWVEIGIEMPEFILKAFVFAAKSGSDSAIQTLRRHGGDINIKGRQGHTALVVLVASGDLEGSRRLLANGADVNICARTSRLAPLSISAGEGKVEMTIMLLDYGASLENQDHAGLTAFHLASRNDEFQTASLLLQKGANVNTYGADGMTPLISAALNDQMQMIELLLNHGAHINARDNEGRTPLMLAAQRAPIDTIRLLLERKADISIRSDNGFTAFEWARYSQRPEAEELLSSSAT